MKAHLRSLRISQNIFKCLAMTAIAEKGGFKDPLDYSCTTKLCKRMKKKTNKDPRVSRFLVSFSLQIF